MDIGQIVLIVIIVLGLALAAGAVILVTGGPLAQPRSDREDQQDELNDEDAPPPEGAWKATTWYSNATEGTLFPNQPSPSFRLSADTSFHRAIARIEQMEQDAQMANAPTQPEGTAGSDTEATTGDVQAFVSKTETPETSEGPEEMDAQPTMPIPALSQPLASADGKAGDTDPDTVTLIPTRPTLPPLAGPALAPAIAASARDTDEAKGNTDALVMQQTLPSLPAFPRAPTEQHDQAKHEHEIAPVEDAAATGEVDEQPTFTALPTVPMTAVPVPDDLPPTVKLRSIRRPPPTVPLPEDAGVHAEQADHPMPGEGAEEQDTDEQQAQPSQQEDDASVEGAKIETADEIEELTELPTGAGALPFVPLAEPQEDTDTEHTNTENTNTEDADTSELTATIAASPAPESQEPPTASDSPFPSHPEQTQEQATPAQDETPATNMFTDVFEESGQFDTADWPAIIQGMATAEDEAPTAHTPDAVAQDDDPAMPAIFLSDLEETPVAPVKPVVTKTREEAEPSSTEEARAADPTHTTDTTDTTETEAQHYDRLMVEAYSEVTEVVYDADHDLVRDSFIGCPVRQSTDVAWVFKAIGRKMQALMPPGTWRQYAMLFDVAGLELAPEAETAWRMVLDAFVTHACPEVAPGMALAAQYNSLNDTPATETAAEQEQRPLALARSYDEALRIIQERRAGNSASQE